MEIGTEANPFMALVAATKPPIIPGSWGRASLGGQLLAGLVMGWVRRYSLGITMLRLLVGWRRPFIRRLDPWQQVGSPASCT